MEKIKLPTFRGKPLIKISKTTPRIEFLEGDFGKAFLEEYRTRVNVDYNDNSSLKALKYEDGVVKGSNPFAVVLANQILREENLRTATQADLEKILKLDILPLKGTYEDTGLVLRNEENEYSKDSPLEKNLSSQMRARRIKFSSRNPVMIPLTGLELENSDNDYGLIFKLREDAEVYESPVLAKDGKFNSKDIDEKTGLPKKVSTSGDRNLYTRDSGLSGLYLNVNLDLYSNDRGFNNSGVPGRVVVMKAKATPQENKK